MRHRVAGRKLSRPTHHRLALYRNLVTDLLRYEKIVTTEAKAKEVRGLGEEIITLGKHARLATQEGTPAARARSVHLRRQALAFIYGKEVVDKVFSVLAERYAQRPGGYTRLVKLGPRAGDAAPLVKLELVP